METQNENVEKLLRQQLKHIAPARSFFEQVSSSVTDIKQTRYISEEFSKPSTYQLIVHSNFMRKYFIIASGAAALLVVVVAFKSISGPATVATNITDGNTPLASTDSQAQNQPNAPTAPNGEATTINKTATPTPTNSSATSASASSDVLATIDSVTDSLNGSADAEASSASSETTESDAVKADLQNYSDVNNNSYDSTI